MARIWATGRGFTLLELVVVMALLALLSISLPLAITQFQPDKQRREVTADLVTELRRLRSQARQSGLPTYFRKDSMAKKLPAGIALEIMGRNGQAAHALGFFPDGSSTAGNILIRNASASTTISVMPFSGKIKWQ